MCRIVSMEDMKFKIEKDLNVLSTQRCLCLLSFLFKFFTFYISDCYLAVNGYFVFVH